MMKRLLVTTLDNPYDPFTQFKEWNAFDLSMGYNTCSYLARLTRTSSELSDNENQEEINKAVEDIVRLNLLGIYKKLERNDDESEEENEDSISSLAIEAQSG